MRSLVVTAVTIAAMAGLAYVGATATGALRIAAIVLQVPVSYWLGTIGFIHILSASLKSAVKS